MTNQCSPYSTATCQRTCQLLPWTLSPEFEYPVFTSTTYKNRFSPCASRCSRKKITSVKSMLRQKRGIASYIFVSELDVENVAIASCILEGTKRTFAGDSHFDRPVSLIRIERHDWVHPPGGSHLGGRRSTAQCTANHASNQDINRFS